MMNDLYCFNSVKLAVVFILMLLLSTTLEAQRNEKDKFFDLMTAIGEHLGGEFNDAEKALKLDLNGAHSFLEGLHTFTAREIIRKNKNGEFECIDRKESTKSDFKMAIKTILGEDMINLVKVIPKNVDKETYALLSTVLDKTLKPNKKVEDLQSLLKELSVKFSEKKLFNLLFSLAARLEALVHRKNIDGTLKEKQKNPKDKIQTFLAVPKCFQESDLSTFDYWIEIIEMKTQNSQKPIFAVAIYKEKYNILKSEPSKKEAFKLSRENYEILKQLNDQKFSIYEATKLLREIYNHGYNRSIPKKKLQQIFENLLKQINYIFFFNWKRNEHWNKNYKCEYAMLFQNISESLMKMMSDKGIGPELHLNAQDFKIREDVQKDFEENCKKFENEEAKIIFLNNVHYELTINFEFNQWKEVLDRAEDLWSDWVDNSEFRVLWISKLCEELYLKTDAWEMLSKIENFMSNTNKERLSMIEALIGKKFNLGSLYDQMKWLVEETIPEEQTNLWHAKKEINTKQLEKDIEFLKKNPKSIAEEKYQKAVAIICTIKQHDENVKMLKSKKKIYQTSEAQNRLNYSSLKIRQYRKDFGPELWEQTKESCKQLKLKQIKMKETVSDEILDDLYEIWKSFNGGWRGIEEYYLKIPLMQVTEQALTLAKTFEKMLQNVKEHYAKKMDASNVGGE